ncbi:isocitrate lyase/phosphoenolpyruvate mutase family protein [Candidatus Bipolaricaulota bacterium]
MDTLSRVDKANQFHTLHDRTSVLLLPGVWDVVSAKLYETEGFSAIGTTSAGIASTLGLPDGQRMTIDDTAAVVRRIVAQIKIPVSADIEAGYSDTAKGVAASARAIIDAGAVGINIEDSLSGCGIDHDTSLFEVEKQMDRITAIREVADAAGIPLLINARTDVFLLDVPDLAAGLDAAIMRASLYIQAGADCAFIPDMESLDEASISHLVRNIDGPINLIAGARTPSVPRLQEIGVARLSFGPRPMRTALSMLRQLAREWLDCGTYSKMLEGGLSYSEVNDWFSADP